MNDQAEKTNEAAVLKIGAPSGGPAISPIENVAKNYIQAIRGIAQTAQIALPHFDEWKNAELNKIAAKLNKYVPIKSEKEHTTFKFTAARDFAEFTETWREFKEHLGQNPSAVLAKSLFTHLFAEFDSYIGELLRVIYLKSDKLIKGISREISLSDLMDFSSLADVKVAMVDKEIDTFRRESYIEQFAALERKLGLSLRKFKEWPAFVELSQRRNLLIHNGGLVSEQYLTVCAKEKYSFADKVKIGDPLEVSFEYFSTASRILSKVGLMLAYTLWSKLFPEEAPIFHMSLNETMYHCLQHKRWKFVGELRDFVLSEPLRKDLSEMDLRIRIINAAIGLKFSGDTEGASDLLKSVDWTASIRDFKLATVVLKDEYAEAVEIMKSIGKAGEIIQQSCYHSWPLFTEFRKQPEFYKAYAEIYGEPFSETVQTSDGAVRAQATAPETLPTIDMGQPVGEAEVREITPKKVASKRAKSASKAKPVKS
ncbi:hypothetical protein [Variovorax sp. PMC12]|uniref:hypothetical protein n=1 Tax=Variovorax sp. PMC12 TaxID=2126319 RepID=UPI00131C5094|nr:hypothetical protein [Variovorax sp. PMC12]